MTITEYTLYDFFPEDVCAEDRKVMFVPCDCLGVAPTCESCHGSGLYKYVGTRHELVIPLDLHAALDSRLPIHCYKGSVRNGVPMCWGQSLCIAMQEGRSIKDIVSAALGDKCSIHRSQFYRAVLVRLYERATRARIQESPIRVIGRRDLLRITIPESEAEN